MRTETAVPQAFDKTPIRRPTAVAAMEDVR
jgi:hypothetical protein